MKSKKKTSDKLERVSPVEITKFAFGVRYDPQYAIMDRIGAVLDKVLRAQGTPFGPETFPLSQSGTIEHVLINNKTKDSLRITQRDTILQMTVETRKLKKFQFLAEEFNEFVLMALREFGKLKSVERFGFLLRLAECGSLLSTPPIEDYIADDFKSTRKLFLNFTRYLPSEEAILRRNVDDYRNAIYTVQQSEKGDVDITIDYQEYFKPVLSTNDWKKKPFPNFVDNGLEYFENEFDKWFNKFRSKAEAA